MPVASLAAGLRLRAVLGCLLARCSDVSSAATSWLATLRLFAALWFASDGAAVTNLGVMANDDPSSKSTTCA